MLKNYDNEYTSYINIKKLNFPGTYLILLPSIKREK